MAENARLIDFERCLNFRDLGGYEAADGRKVAWGRLYRSMTPEFMTEADVARARDDLRIRRVIDLRDRPDLDSGPIGYPPAQRTVIRFAEVAHFPEIRDLPVVDVLRMHLDISAPAIAEAIQLLSDDCGGASVFHCQTGKDRTGVLAAIILRLLGVDTEDVVSDYMLGAPIAADVHALATSLGRPPRVPPPKSALEPPDERAMRALLTRMDEEFGGARSYVEGVGVPGEVIDRFVHGMLD